MRSCAFECNADVCYAGVSAVNNRRHARSFYLLELSRGRDAILKSAVLVNTTPIRKRESQKQAEWDHSLVILCVFVFVHCTRSYVH